MKHLIILIYVYFLKIYVAVTPHVEPLGVCVCMLGVGVGGWGWGWGGGGN